MRDSEVGANDSEHMGISLGAQKLDTNISVNSHSNFSVFAFRRIKTYAVIYVPEIGWFLTTFTLRMTGPHQISVRFCA